MTDLVNSIIADAIKIREEWIDEGRNQIEQYEAMIANTVGFIQQYAEEIIQLKAGLNEPDA